MSIETDRKTLLVVGPCAAESRKQILCTAERVLMQQEKSRTRGEDIEFILRAPFFKPRSEAAWDGMGLHNWISISQEVLNMGLNIGTEVYSRYQIQRIRQEVLGCTDTGKVLVWTGARCQLHPVHEVLGQQSRIEHVLAVREHREPRLIVMAKNAMWRDARHHAGIASHIIKGWGETPIPNDGSIILCHRGFPEENERGFRNNPDFMQAAAWRSDADELLRKHGDNATSFPVIVDVSHTAGHRGRVIDFARESLSIDRGWRFNGIIAEVHPDPVNAATDAKQQLNLDEFDMLMEVIRDIRVKRLVAA